MMRGIAFAALLAIMPSGAAATDTPHPLTLEQRMILRCSAAFALVARGQADGDARALAYPTLGETGREFFVRNLAALMVDTGLDRDALAALVRGEAEALLADENIDKVMPPCLALLAQE